MNANELIMAQELAVLVRAVVRALAKLPPPDEPDRARWTRELNGLQEQLALLSADIAKYATVQRATRPPDSQARAAAATARAAARHAVMSEPCREEQSRLLRRTTQLKERAELLESVGRAFSQEDHAQLTDQLHQHQLHLADFRRRCLKGPSSI